MATAEDDLQAFNQFVRQRLTTSDPSEVQLGQLMDEWQLLQMTNAVGYNGLGRWDQRFAWVNLHLMAFKGGIPI